MIICICRKRKLTNSHHTRCSMKWWNFQCFSMVDMWWFSNLRSFLWIWYVFCWWRVSLNSRCNLMVLVDWCWCANLMKWFRCTACLWIKCWAAWNKEGKIHEFCIWLYIFTSSFYLVYDTQLGRNFGSRKTHEQSSKILFQVIVETRNVRMCCWCLSGY